MAQDIVEAAADMFLAPNMGLFCEGEMLAAVGALQTTQQGMRHKTDKWMKGSRDVCFTMIPLNVYNKPFNSNGRSRQHT